jgi:hypothetical protein
MGEQLEVLVEGRGDHLSVRLPNGSTTRIPRAWTDADGATECREPESMTVFTAEALRELIEIVDALLRRT